MEWIIIDDGTDKIGSLVSSIYQRSNTSATTKKMPLRCKNAILLHEKSKGDIIVYMDDDDYYPSMSCISHAVERLQQNPEGALCWEQRDLHILQAHR